MTIPTFIDTRLDEDIEQGASGGPSFMTTIMPLSGGQEKRNIEWQFPRQEWDISYGIQEAADFQQVRSMFYNTFGRALGFRFKDWTDYQIGDPVNYIAGNAQAFATGDGTTLVFQIYKAYTISAYTMLRKITRPVSGTAKIYDNGTLVASGVSVNYDTGQVTFTGAPTSGHTLSISCEFDVPVRFDSDLFKQKITWIDAQELPTIAILELKE